MLCAVLIALSSCKENDTILTVPEQPSKIISGEGQLTHPFTVQLDTISGIYRMWTTNEFGLFDNLSFDSSGTDLSLSCVLSYSFDYFPLSVRMPDSLPMTPQLVLYSSRDIRVMNPSIDDSTIVPATYVYTGPAYFDIRNGHQSLFFESAKGNWGRFDIDQFTVTPNDSLLISSGADSVAFIATVKYRWCIQENGTRKLY
jgi:hypothetical protein